MRLLTLAAIFSLIVAVLGQDAGSGLFLFPPGQAGDGQPGLMFNFNDVLISSWTSYLQGPIDLVLYGSDIAGTSSEPLMNTTVPAAGSQSFSFGSIADTTKNWPVLAHFKLEARKGNSGFISHNFSITSMNAPPRTLMATSTGSPSPLTTLSTMTASMSSLVTNSSTADPNSASGSSGMRSGDGGSFFRDDRHHFGHRGHGLSSGATIGIVVGVIVGGLALLIPAACFHLRRRRSRREFELRAAREQPNVPPKDTPRSDLQHQPSNSSSERSMRKPSIASTTIVVGMAPSRRPTDATARPDSLAVHELHSSGIVISEMPASPLRKPVGEKIEAENTRSIQVYEMESENARLEKEIYQKLENR